MKKKVRSAQFLLYTGRKASHSAAKPPIAVMAFCSVAQVKEATLAGTAVEVQQPLLPLVTCHPNRKAGDRQAGNTGHTSDQAI